MTIEVFIKKPEKVEVLKYDGTNYDEVVKFLGNQICNLKCVDTNDYIVKYNNKIIVTHDKPNFANQELLGTYNKDAVQGVNPNTHISLEKLQEFFEVPIVSCKEQGQQDNDMAPTKTKGDCGVKKYQKKPLIVEAVKNEGNNIAEIMQFTKCQCSAKVYGPAGFEYLVPTSKGTMTAKVGDYIIKGVEGEFYLCKPDEFEATYDEYNEQQDSNHTSKPSGFSLRDLVMQIAPKHIKYYIKRLEEYGFKLIAIKDVHIQPEGVFLSYIVLKDKNGYQIWIQNRKECGGEDFQLIKSGKCSRFEVKNNNWREAFNKLVASFPDEIMKNTNHHAGLTS